MLGKIPNRRQRVIASLLLLVGAGGLLGCADPLAVEDPTAILESEVNDAEGAELLRRGALRVLYVVVPAAVREGGLLADEFRAQQASSFDLSGTFSSEEALDRREAVIVQEESGVASYSNWQQLRMRETTVAIAKLRAYAPDSVRQAGVGEMLAVRGYAAMRLAEDFCPGFPLHDVVDYEVIYGPPLSTEQALEYALAAFDSAAVWAANSPGILDFVRLGRARTLLNLGRFREAAVAASVVPTAYAYQTEYSATSSPSNTLASEPPGWQRWGSELSVADREGDTGLDFVSANDPRVPTIQRGTSRDSVTPLYAIAKYPSRATPIVLASGVEARLIEAEAALQAGDPSWLSILNQLRATQINPALGPLDDPGTVEARVDLLFRERAFWLFATGSRLGDLRRLVRQYGRASETVFPTGGYYRGGIYNTGTSLPFSRAETQFSPGVTGCTSL